MRRFCVRIVASEMFTNYRMFVCLDALGYVPAFIRDIEADLTSLYKFCTIGSRTLGFSTYCFL